MKNSRSKTIDCSNIRSKALLCHKQNKSVQQTCTLRPRNRLSNFKLKFKLFFKTNKNFEYKFYSLLKKSFVTKPNLKYNTLLKLSKLNY